MIERVGLVVGAMKEHCHGSISYFFGDWSEIAVESVRPKRPKQLKIFGARRSLEEAIVQLRSLAGVGEWTAQYIAMRELREPDAFPAADIGLMRAMEDSSGRRPTPSELLARAEAWRPWRAYAAQHLWSSWADRAAEQRKPKEGAKSRHSKEAVSELEPSI